MDRQLAQQVPSYLTTGQAAKLCEVTPDTILKWIRKGRLAGARTAGGHYRINLRDLRPHIPPGRGETLSPETGACARPSMRCWEYLSNGGAVRNSCKQCVVYRVGATGCFLMADMETEIGHARRFCETSCDACVYYRRVTGLATNVLVITADEVLVEQLASEDDEYVTLRFASSAYGASATIENFRPAFAVVDQELLATKEIGLLESLSRDSRVPGLKVVLVQPSGGTDQTEEIPKTELIVSVLQKPLRSHEIADVIGSFPVDSLPPEGCEP